MRWLVIVLLVSLGVLLLAAAAAALHIWRQRARMRRNLRGSDRPVLDQAEETDLEIEP